MKYTLGEKLGLFPAKPTSVGNYHDHKLCACGRGYIEYDYIDGVLVSVHRVWNGGVDFGQLSFSDCCAQCEREEHEDQEYLEGTY